MNSDELRAKWLELGIHKLAECEAEREAAQKRFESASELSAARGVEITELRQFVADTVEGMDCLPTCDSTAHDELCPVAHPVEAWRVLREKLAERERKMANTDTLDLAHKIAEAVSKAWPNGYSHRDHFPKAVEIIAAALTETGEGEKER